MTSPPHFIEGERAILASCLIDNDVLPHLCGTLRVTDFYKESHRILFNAITALYPQQAVDWVTLTAWLKDQGQLEAVGGPGELAELVDAVPSTANVAHYIRLVKEKAVRRQIIQSCREALVDSSSDKSIEEVISGLQRNCLSVLVDGKKSGPRQFKYINRESFEMLQKHVEQETQPGLRSGFAGLDEQTGGLRIGDLVVVCARPSMGKSAFAANVAVNVALSGGLVLVFSLEMQNADLWGRIIAKQSKIPFWYIRNASLSRNDWSRIIKAIGDLDEIPLWIDDSPSLSPTEVLLRTQKISLELKARPTLIVIDYLQIMRPDEKNQNREREVSSISAACKGIAKQLECPVMLLSQLNREVTKRKDQRPQLSDLRESGAIEQDADVVIGIFRKWPLEQIDANKTHAEIGVLKQRNGPIGWDKDIEWDPNTVSFRDKQNEQREDPTATRYDRDEQVDVF
jgi:replicative DNA helicase